MKPFILAIYFLFFISISTNGQDSLALSLFELPNVVFTKIEHPENFKAAYELQIKQPIDHNNPEIGHFYQKVFLSHLDFNQPMVIVTEGYNRPKNRIYELTTLLKANQLDVEHRYFGSSLPDQMDYQYLTFEQAAADLHYIKEIFKDIYQKKWVSTGISKGGQTSIYYRYFYPNDVAASVPYVAPHNTEFEDQRIYNFLDTIGTEECRQALLDVQLNLLRNREQVLPLLKWYAKGAKLKFTYLTFEEAFEYAVLEYPFSFWQWGSKCNDIPAKESDLEKVIEHFINVSGIDFFADGAMENFASHYYQAATQMGYYGYETEDFKGLLKALPMKPHPHAAFTPGKMKVKFDGSLAKKVDRWLKTEAKHMAYIYGANDTWSATAVQPNDKTDCLWFFLKGKDHGQARIKNMTGFEKKVLMTKLNQWLGEGE